MKTLSNIENSNHSHIHIYSIISDYGTKFEHCEVMQENFICFNWQLSAEKQVKSLTAIFQWQKQRSQITMSPKSKDGTEHWIDLPSFLPDYLHNHFVIHATYGQLDLLKLTKSWQGNKKTVISVPAYGLFKGVWIDGWCSSYNSYQQIQSLLPPGCISKLQIDLTKVLEPTGYSLTELSPKLPSTMEAKHQCILTGLALSLKTQKSFDLQIHNFDKLEAIYLLLLRQAFSHHKIKIHSKEKTKLWPKRFKNFLECIGAKWKDLGSDKLKSKPVKELFASYSCDEIVDLYDYLNKPTAILTGIKH